MFGNLYLEPSHYVHIARNTPGADNVRLIVKFRTSQKTTPHFDHTITDVTSQCQVTIAGSGTTPVIAVYNSSTQLLEATGTATGENIITVRLNSTTDTAADITCKVRVHNVMNSWWMGNTSIDVPVHPNVFHCQLSILANFDADPATKVGRIGDISGHGFVELDLPLISSTDPNPLIELGEGNNGRIKAMWIGSTNIRGKFLSKEETVEVKTTNFYGNPSDWNDYSTFQVPNEFLKKVIIEREYTNPKDPKHSVPATIDDRCNLLFISEGFTADQQEVFDSIVQQMSDQLFTSPSFSPYNKLGGNFNIWKAFFASMEPGITRTSKVGEAPFTGSKPLIPQSTNSNLGIYFTRREGDQLVTEGDEPGVLGLPQKNSGSIIADPRRMPYEFNWIKAYGRHIATLANTITGDKIGQKWFNELPFTDPKSFLRDLGFVCILVNEPDNEYFAAANYGFFMIMNIKLQKAIVPKTTLQQDGFVWKYVVRHDNDLAALQKDVKNNLTAMTDLLAHELSHSYALGDEYEKGGVGVASSRSDSNFSNINTFDELGGVTAGNVLQIDPTRLNWNIFHRVEMADTVKSIIADTNDSSLLHLTLTLNTSNVTRWKKIKDAGRKLFLREFRPLADPVLFAYGGLQTSIHHFNDMPRRSGTPLVVITSLEIIDTMGKDQIKLAISRSNLPAVIQAIPAAEWPQKFSAMFSPNGCLFLPLLYKNGPQADQPVTLVDYEVMAFMQHAKAPLHTNWDASSGACSLSQSDQDVNNPPAGITVTSKRKYPRHDFMMIGAYEGGDHNSCKVYRPAGSCRLRHTHAKESTRHAHLCYYCKYYIANHVNAGSVEWIENEYPALK